MKKDRKYQKDLPKRLYLFFASYSEGVGVPSFTKFARAMGITTEDVERFREHKEFDKAYRECTEIRRDYLIDNALSKRFDSSFAKFLLQEEENALNLGNGGEKINFTLKVLGESGD